MHAVVLAFCELPLIMNRVFCFIFCLFLLQNIVSSQNATCPDSSIFSDLFNGCLYGHPNERTFPDAEQTCVSLNGHLVSIHNNFQQSAVYQFQQDHVGGRDVWIGFYRDFSKPTDWAWTDNSNVTWVKWEKGEPVGDVAFISYNYWSTTDRFFNRPLAFVCLLPTL